jgi:lipocalin-like protein
MEFSPGVDNGFGIIITDIYNDFIMDCSKDDLITFNNDGTLTEDEGETKCDPSDLQTTNDATWTLTNNNETLTIIDPDLGPSPATIILLNETTLKVSKTEIPDIGIPTDEVTTIITMTLQN